MDGAARERLEAGEVGDVRPVQLPEGGDDGMEPALFRAVRTRQRDHPLRGILVPARLLEPGVELDALRDAGAVGDLGEVVVDLAALRELVGPIGLLRERVRVAEGRGVQAHAGVAVLPPGAAQGGRLLDHRERHARLQQTVARGDARDAGADHEHLEVTVARDIRVLETGDAVLVGREIELVLQGGPVLGLPVREEVEDRVDLRGGQDADRADAAIAQSPQGGECDGPSPIHLRLSHPAVRLRVGVDQREGRAQVALEDRRIAEGRGEGGEQRRKVGPLDDVGEFGVGLDDGLVLVRPEQVVERDGQRRGERSGVGSHSSSSREMTSGAS